MNKLIQELSLQAGIAANLSADVVERDKNKWIDLYSEKFARLIVQECIAQCESQNTVITTATGTTAWGEISDAVEQIREHFGVAE